MASDGVKIINTVCAHNCGGRSYLACTVRDGRFVKVEPAETPDPNYKGLCVRCLTLPQWVYSEERIASPMRRVGDRGSGDFEEISWDQALDEIAQRFQSLIDDHGASSLAFSRTSGSSQLGNYSRLAALLGGGGTANFFGGVDMAVHMGLNNILGFKGMFGQAANEWTDRERSKVYIVWGNNPAETSMTFMKFLLDARDQGTEVIVIDPRYSATAMHANWWVAPRPGTDLALALGILHVLITDHLVDLEFIAQHTVGPLLVRRDTGKFLRLADIQKGGSKKSFIAIDRMTGEPAEVSQIKKPKLEGRFEVARVPVATAYTLLKEMVERHTPDQVAEDTGISAQDIHALAHRYGTGGPATIGFGYGVDRYRHGELLTRAGATMAILTGNIGRPGTGVGVQSHGIGTREASLGSGPVLPDWAHTESVPNIEVGTRPLSVRALFCQGDWLNQRMADMEKAKAYLAGLEFVVTVDHFWQTTAEWSDIVLPASTFLEGRGRIRDAVVAGNGVYLRQPVLEPIGKSRPDCEIEKALADRLGLGEWFQDSPEDIVRQQIDLAEDPALEHITLDELFEAGGSLPLNIPKNPNVQFTDFFFPTKTGRAEFYVEDLVDFGEELPYFVEDHEALRSHNTAKKFPLVLMQAHARQRAHSTFFNTRWTLEVWPEPVLELNPDDARLRGLKEGDLGEAYNERGHVVARIVCNPDYPSGVCNLSEGWKQQQYISGNVQALTNREINLAQKHLWGHANIPFYDTRVDVRVWKEEMQS